MVVNICNDYTETPGARYISEGKFSGEDFRDNVLEGKFLKAIENKEKLVIELDGGFGYPPSFLEEAFGGLARKYGGEKVAEVLEFVSNDEPSLVDEIRGYILSE